jgi:hypothetical protein
MARYRPYGIAKAETGTARLEERAEFLDSFSIT